MNNVKKKQKTPWQLIAIFTVTVVPVVAAYVAFYTGIGVPESTVNKGTLLEPTVDVAALIQGGEGDIPSFTTSTGPWRLVIPITATCDADCEQNLYITRQVHIRLADKATRVERLAVNLAADVGRDYLASIAREQPHLQELALDHNRWSAVFDGNNTPTLDQGHFYLLVDPLGRAMMFYTAKNEGNDLLDDIKRVIRFSPEG